MKAKLSLSESEHALAHRFVRQGTASHRTKNADRISSRCLLSTFASTLQEVIWHGMLFQRSLKCSARVAERCRIHSVAPLKLGCPVSFDKTSRQRISANS
jgi:hypothetical protein